jgi:hypothetical protein
LSAQEIFLTDRLKDCSWALSHRQSAPLFRQGGQVVTYGQPFWVANFRYENLSREGLRALSAWIGRRQGSRVPFTAYRPSRATPANGITSNSGIGINAYDTAASTITLSGLGAALVAGDMVSWRTQYEGYWCGEVVSAGSISGGVQTLTMSPAPIVYHGTLSAPRIYQAIAEFQLEGDVQIGEPHDKRFSVSFAARQVERAP